MSRFTYSFSIIAALVVALLTLQIQGIEKYFVQVFALTILLFFIVKRVYGSHLFELAPVKETHRATQSILEMALLTYGISIFVGATGGTQSNFFLFIYIYLFFVSFSAQRRSALLIAGATMIFFYLLDPILGTDQVIALLSIPVMLGIFLFSKKQYDQAQINQAVAQEEALEIEFWVSAENNIESFVSSFLKPKLTLLEGLSQEIVAQEQSERLPSTVAQGTTLTPQTAKTLHTQLSLLQSEIDKVLQVIRQQKSAE